jgi:hypothetical protein
MPPNLRTPHIPLCSPPNHHPRHKQSNPRSKSIQRRIPRRCRPSRHKNLVDLIERRHRRAQQERPQSPLPTPLAPRCTKSAKRQQTKNKVFGDVPQFPDQVMHFIQHRHVRVGENPAQDWHDDAAGMLGAKDARRKSGDHRRPHDHRTPISQPFHIDRRLIVSRIIPPGNSAPRA